ncbi:MAG: hypothetical protein F4018_04345, partial [Acidobacteria bacterium]|nr:hypothetical protein [Acidobacteriota bacterium]
MHVAEIRVAGEEDERAARGDPQQRGDLPGDSGGERRMARRRHLARQVEDGLLAIVELRRQPQLGGVGDAQPSPEVREGSVDRQGGGGQDRALHPLDQQLADDARYVDRGGPQKHSPAAPFHEIDVGGVAGGQKERELRADLVRPPAERRQIRVPRRLGEPGKRAGEIAQAPPEAAGRLGDRGERVGSHAAALPAGSRRKRAEEEMGVAAHTVQQVQQLEHRRFLELDGRRRIACDESPAVVVQLVEPVVADGDPEVLRGHVFELMRFVDHRDRARGNDLAVRALAHGGVRAQQMMVDDDDVRLRR